MFPAGKNRLKVKQVKEADDPNGKCPMNIVPFFLTIQMVPCRRVINVRVLAFAKCIKGVQTEETTTGRIEETNG